ncbi:hypothetical protein [Okeania sp. SIO1H2]|uniref:hypothetical protein n=1 Tax=Okeania sp. SIO1H2 TaxID=2607775 RepID=UPI0013CAC036|nr:hypothetical protein [Okeania sp. SIO1H2]NET16709.1 hypothetical protein [Okeania sp. SIO1H6]NET95982.1 hypothetical protein [Okeania sp. SIO1H2]
MSRKSYGSAPSGFLWDATRSRVGTTQIFTTRFNIRDFQVNKVPIIHGKKSP